MQKSFFFTEYIKEIEDTNFLENVNISRFSVFSEEYIKKAFC